MKTRRENAAASPIFTVLLPMLCLLFTNGCAGNRQYRTELRVCANTNAPESHEATLERTPKYLLGFVEFDDQGWLWSRTQMDTVLGAIRQEMGTNWEKGVLIVTFVHGWKNNAAYDNENVQKVRETLNYLAKVEAKATADGVTPRRIVGVYVGWRGLTLKGWAAKQTTFWGRKRTGHEVGRGALAELFLRLEAMVNSSKEAVKEAAHRAVGERPVASRLMIVGHSFGAAATYSAVAPLYLERILVPHHPNEGGKPGFGDLVVLVNPAFEAARFHVLRDAASSRRTDGTTQDQLLNLAIFTSKGDTATKNLFPIGRFFTALFQSHRTNGQHHANVTAVGHYKQYLTHNLAPKPQEPNQTGPPQQQATDDNEVEQARSIVQSASKKLREARGQPGVAKVDLEYVSTRLKPWGEATFSPFIVAQVDTKLVPDHNNIWRAQFASFLGQFMLTFAEEDELKTTGK